MGFVDFEAMKRLITVSDVLALINWQPRSTSGGERRGACPIHKSGSKTSRCFCTDGNSFMCHKCRAKGDAFDLYGLLNNMSPFQAVKQLATLKGIEVLYLGRPATGLPR